MTDLLEAWLFIAEESIDAADGVIEAIHQEAQTLSLQPQMLRLLYWRVPDGDGLLKQNIPQPR